METTVDRKQWTGLLLAGFLLGLYRGQAAVWRTDAPGAVTVLPYTVSVLPEVDRAALEAGIYAETPGDLSKLTEDFFS